MEGYRELTKSKGHWNTRRKNVGLILFATELPERILLTLIMTQS